MNVNEFRILSGGNFPFDVFSGCDRLDVVVFSASVAGVECLLSGLARKSVRVRILAVCAQDDFKERCRGRGVEVKFWGRAPSDRWIPLPPLHAKGFLGEGQGASVALIGSSNLSRAALSGNVEFLLRGDDGVCDELGEWFSNSWDYNGFGDNRPWDVPQDVAAEDWDLKCVTRLHGLVRNEPKKFQVEVIDSIWGWLKEGPFDKGRIAKLPTGAGKTLIAAEVVLRYLEAYPDKVVLWTCHTVQPLVQAALCFVRQAQGGIKFSIGTSRGSSVSRRFEEEYCELFERMGKYLGGDDGARVFFCTYDALGKEKYTPKDIWNKAGLLVVDEAHRYASEGPGGRGNRRVVRIESRVAGHALGTLPRLGLTATPDFDHVESLGRLWLRDGCFGESISEECLCSNSYLARVHEGSWSEPTGFEFWVPRGMSEIALTFKVGDFNCDPVNKAIVRAADDGRLESFGVKRVLVFVGTIEQAKKVVCELRKGARNASRAQFLHSKMSHLAQVDAIMWFKGEGGDRRILVTVMMAAEGLDLPRIDCVIFARPTFSPILLQQMKGRGLRGPKMGGTEKCVFVDLVHQYVDEQGRKLPEEQQPLRYDSVGYPKEVELWEPDEVERDEEEEKPTSDVSDASTPLVNTTMVLPRTSVGPSVDKLSKESTPKWKMGLQKLRGQLSDNRIYKLKKVYDALGKAGLSDDDIARRLGCALGLVKRYRSGRGSEKHRGELVGLIDVLLGAE